MFNPISTVQELAVKDATKSYLENCSAALLAHHRSRDPDDAQVPSKFKWNLRRASNESLELNYNERANDKYARHSLPRKANGRPYSFFEVKKEIQVQILYAISRIVHDEQEALERESVTTRDEPAFSESDAEQGAEPTRAPSTTPILAPIPESSESARAEQARGPNITPIHTPILEGSTPYNYNQWSGFSGHYYQGIGAEQSRATTPGKEILNVSYFSSEQSYPSLSDLGENYSRFETGFEQRKLTYALEDNPQLSRNPYYQPLFEDLGEPANTRDQEYDPPLREQPQQAIVTQQPEVSARIQETVADEQKATEQPEAIPIRFFSQDQQAQDTQQRTADKEIPNSEDEKSDEADQTALPPPNPPPRPIAINMANTYTAPFAGMAAARKAVLEYGIPEFNAHIAPPDSMRSERRYHLSVVQDFFAEYCRGESDKHDDPAAITHNIMVFKAIVQATWKGNARDHWGKNVIADHSRVLTSDRTQIIGYQYPPATLTTQRYQHPGDNTNTNRSICGYAELLKEAGRVALEKGEQPRYSKLDWKQARYDGAPDKLTRWEQTVDALAKQYNLPDDISAPYGKTVCNGIAANFTDLAAETWAKEPNKPEQIYSKKDNNGTITEKGLFQWAREHFLSSAWMEEKYTELTTLRWVSGKETHVGFNQRFKYLLIEAGQADTAHKLTIEWYLNAMPKELARGVRRAMTDAVSFAREQGTPIVQTLSYAMDLAQQHHSNWERERSRSHESTQTSKSKNSQPQQQKSQRTSHTGTNRRNDDQKVTCYACQQEGHIARDCPQGTKRAEKKIPCRECGVDHPWGKHVFKNNRTKPARLAQPVKDVIDTKGKQHKQPAASKEAVAPPTGTVEALHCITEVEGHQLKLLVDTGLWGVAVTKKTLNKIGRKIDKSTKIALSLASGATYHALGEVTDLRFELDGAEFLTNAYVVEAEDFDLAMGWNFIKEYTGEISARKMVLTLWLDGDIIEVPLEDGMPPPKPKFADPRTTEIPITKVPGRYGQPWGITVPPPQPRTDVSLGIGPICWQLMQWVEHLRDDLFHRSPFKQHIDHEGLCHLADNKRTQKFRRDFPDWRTGNNLSVVPHHCGSTDWRGARNGYPSDDCMMCRNYQRLHEWARDRPDDKYYQTCRCTCCTERRGEPYFVQIDAQDESKPDSPPPVAATPPLSQPGSPMMVEPWNQLIPEESGPEQRMDHSPTTAYNSPGAYSDDYLTDNPDHLDWDNPEIMFLGVSAAERDRLEPQYLIDRNGRRARECQPCRQMLPQGPRSPHTDSDYQIGNNPSSSSDDDHPHYKICRQTSNGPGCYKVKPINQFIHGAERCEPCRQAEMERRWKAKKAARSNSSSEDSMPATPKDAPRRRRNRKYKKAQQQPHFEWRGAGTANHTTRFH